MLRFLVLLLLGLLLWLALERSLSRLLGGGRRDGSRLGRPEGPPAVSRQLIRCDGCGVHVPGHRARRREGRTLCDRCREP